MPDAADADVTGALFGLTSDAVVLLAGDEVRAWNPAAEALFGVPAAQALAPGAQPLGAALPLLRALPEHGAPVRLELPPHGVVEAVRHRTAEAHVLLLRDVSVQVKRERGLRRLGELSRSLLGTEPSGSAVLQEVCAVAKEITGAAYSALLLLREGSTTESSHFAYDAPRHLFPERMPRLVGLLAVPVDTRTTVRLEAVLGHPAGVGLPDVHPPLGPLVAAPVMAGEQVLGVVAVSNPIGETTFDALDEGLMTDLAAHAAVAVAWAQVGEREREREALQREVVDTARHDLRTPVGAGRGFAGLLRTRRDLLSGEQVDAALDGLVEAFARIEAFSARLLLDERDGRLEPQWERVQVAVLLEGVAAAAPGSVRWAGDSSAPDAFAADPVLARQALDGLVRAALEETGTVVLTVRTEGEHLRVDVRDEGAGLTEVQQARLFAQDRPDLAVVRRLVEAHGGTVGVSSRPGDGTTSWLTFPLEAPP